MHFTRRDWLKVLGGVAITGCADPTNLVSVEYDDPDGGVDLPPDQEYSADPNDPGDPGSEPEIPDEPEPQEGQDGGVEFDAGEESDAGFDGGSGGDAGASVDGGSSGDAGVSDGGPKLDGGTPDAGPRVDAGSNPDAGIPDFLSVPERPTQFPMGVMAGDATPTSILFWTRYAGTATLRLRVYEMSGSRIVAVRFDQAVATTSGGFARVSISGLRPNRVHRYAFLVGPAGAPTGRSEIGRARTALDPNALTPIRFAGTSCTNINHAPLPVLSRVGARTDLAFFIHAGDHVYADGGVDARSVAEYRAKYANYWKIPGMAALHASAGMYLTWDDHEVFNNWDPETINAGRLSNARQAFFENCALRKNTVDPNRIWRSFRWGKTAEVFILDCRSERKPSTRSANPANPSVYISKAQLDWLKAGLSASPCVFKFIVNSVPIYNRPGPNGSGGDNWTSYASQRKNVLDHIANKGLRGVVWLSGDVHYGGVTTVERSGPHRNIWEVIMGPSGADSANPPNLDPTFWPARAVGVHNYTLFNADPVTRRLKVEYVNAAGKVISGGTWSHVF